MTKCDRNNFKSIINNQSQGVHRYYRWILSDISAVKNAERSFCPQSGSRYFPTIWLVAVPVHGPSRVVEKQGCVVER